MEKSGFLDFIYKNKRTLMKYKTQQEEIKLQLLRGKKISQKKALVYYDIMRLTSVIYALKQQGWEIQTEYRANKAGGRYAVYYMNKDYIKNEIEKMNNIVF